MLSLDHYLIERIKQSDLKAFDELYRRYLKPIYGYIYKRVNHREDAQDITQDVFVRVFRHIKDFRGEASFVTWLYLIAKNEISRFFRKRSQLKRLLRENHLYLEKESSFVERREKEHSIFLLCQAIKSLPLRQRKAVILHAIEEGIINLKEASKELKVSYRQMRRLMRRFEEGKKSLDCLLYHRSHPAWNRTEEPIKKKVVEIFDKYPGINHSHLAGIRQRSDSILFLTGLFASSIREN